MNKKKKVKKSDLFWTVVLCVLVPPIAPAVIIYILCSGDVDL